MSDKMPAIFFGHGNPMNAISSNGYTDAWAAIGRSMPRPKAVLCVSAHWYIPGLAVTAMERPRTIHDFGGFPQELFEVSYPAPGSPALAARVGELIGTLEMDDGGWGLDHGTWSVLCHVFPEADVPVVQLSLDARRPGPWHYELGKCLAPLRDEGVLIAGSGNLVHNLRAFAWGSPQRDAYDWAARFETEARGLLQTGDFAPLVAYERLGQDAQLAIPTPDHYLPLLYALGTRQQTDAISFPVEGTEGGSISMLAVQIG